MLPPTRTAPSDICHDAVPWETGPGPGGGGGGGGGPCDSALRGPIGTLTKNASGPSAGGAYAQPLTVRVAALETATSNARNSSRCCSGVPLKGDGRNVAFSARSAAFAPPPD